jgi:predicted O-methyltransferase YrrM
MPTYNDKLETYLRQTFAVEDEILTSIREQTPLRGLPAIAVKPEEGRFLQFLTAACGARLALEIGTLGGYSGTWIARGLPADGRLITLEKEPDHAAVAKDHFQIAGVSDRVEVRVGKAQDLLPDLQSQGPFDFIFIDAEKEGYPSYLDWALDNLRPGGIVAAHNAFRHGAITDPYSHSPDTEAILQFNQRLAEDSRLVSNIIPTGDGLAVAVMKS